jgi:two-component system, sensor histidine kinase
MKLRSYLAILVLAGVLPLVVLTAVVAVSLVQQQRAAVDDGLADTVAALAGAIDNEIETSIKSLETLGTSRQLDLDDLPGFYEEARRVRDLHRWATIGLIDLTGRPRLDVARPLDAALPDLRDREDFKRVVATGRPYVSDLVQGRGTMSPEVEVAVPVVREGRLKYVLFASVDPARFSAVFETQKLPSDAIASIVSRDGVFIARRPDPTGSIGRALPAAYLERIRATPIGRARRTIAAGPTLETAYQRLTLTGWTVDLGLPVATVIAPVRRIAWRGAFVGGAIVVAALALALVFARRMAVDIRFLASAAPDRGGARGDASVRDGRRRRAARTRA